MGDNSTIHKNIFTVSELTARIKQILETEFAMVWVTGEISSFSRPASGHFYFLLKDRQAQISAVMFRGQNRRLLFRPEDGMQVTCLGRISVYEPRGSYQIIVEHMEPQGVGALQIAFEQLKKKLAEQGLFQPETKIPIPFMPRNIGVVTSPSGAVVHDIIRVIQRRFPNVHIKIFPVKVQGAGASEEIAEALETAQGADLDVLIIARGGGSLEDLQAFNSETVARAIFASEIPVISAVGHETDFTIADFVADLRAPTPSVAAELVVPDRKELQRKCADVSKRLTVVMNRSLFDMKSRLERSQKRLLAPRRRIQDSLLRLDDYRMRICRSMERQLAMARRNTQTLDKMLQLSNPLGPIRAMQDQVDRFERNIYKSFKILLDSKRYQLRGVLGRLHDLDPTAILKRGFSITRLLPSRQIVRSADAVSLGSHVEVVVYKGVLTCRIEGKKANG